MTECVITNSIRLVTRRRACNSKSTHHYALFPFCHHFDKTSEVNSITVIINMIYFCSMLQLLKQKKSFLLICKCVYSVYLKLNIYTFIKICQIKSLLSQSPHNLIFWVGISSDYKATRRLANLELSFSLVRLFSSSILWCVTFKFSNSVLKAMLDFNLYLFIETFPLIEWHHPQRDENKFQGNPEFASCENLLFFKCDVVLEK